MNQEERLDYLIEAFKTDSVYTDSDGYCREKEVAQIAYEYKNAGSVT